MLIVNCYLCRETSVMVAEKRIGVNDFINETLDKTSFCVSIYSYEDGMLGKPVVVPSKIKVTKFVITEPLRPSDRSSV